MSLCVRTQTITKYFRGFAKLQSGVCEQTTVKKRGKKEMLEDVRNGKQNGIRRIHFGVHIMGCFPEFISRFFVLKFLSVQTFYSSFIELPTPTPPSPQEVGCRLPRECNGGNNFLGRINDGVKQGRVQKGQTSWENNLTNGRGETN